MLRYQLGNRNGNTASRKGTLPLTEAAAQAHISLSRAKHIEADALCFLKRRIEENNRHESVQAPELSSEARQAAEKLCAYISSHKRFHVGNIPFFACSADHPEVIPGTADLIVVCKASFSGEQRNCSAYVPKWAISAGARQELCVRIDFPTAKAHLHLRIDNVPAGYIIPGKEKKRQTLQSGCGSWLSSFGSTTNPNMMPWENCTSAAALSGIYVMPSLVGIGA